MITASDFRNGKTFEYEGKVMQVVEFQHVKPGKGAAFVRTKMKNVITGAVTETSFNPTAKFEEAFIERKEMEYSYEDDGLYYFMDTETYDMIPLNGDQLGDAFKFVKENTPCKVLSYKGKVFGVEPPNFMELEVEDRTRRPWRYRYQRDQARYPGDRRGDQGASVHQRRRPYPGRYPYWRIYVPL